MGNDLEYNFLHNQLNANNQIRSFIQQEITTLLNLVHYQRQLLDALNEQDMQINHRINAMGDNRNKALVKYGNISN